VSDVSVGFCSPSARSFRFSFFELKKIEFVFLKITEYKVVFVFLFCNLWIGLVSPLLNFLSCSGGKRKVMSLSLTTLPDLSDLSGLSDLF
jgi:hypothetical protein